MRSLKPTGVHLCLAGESRDKSLKRHADFADQVESFEALLKCKMGLMDEAKVDAARFQQEFDLLAERQKEEHMRVLRETGAQAAAPTVVSADGTETRSRVQWAAGLVSAITFVAAAWFQLWMQTMSTDAFEGVQADGDYTVHYEDEDDPELLADVDSGAMEVEAAALATAAFRPFRTARAARSDPYGTTAEVSLSPDRPEGPFPHLGAPRPRWRLAWGEAPPCRPRLASGGQRYALLMSARCPASTRRSRGDSLARR